MLLKHYQVILQNILHKLEIYMICNLWRIFWNSLKSNKFSTSEELQATLAELADLQSQLADAHADNERLADEKQVLLESLCRQTEKLEDSRTKVWVPCIMVR